VESPAIVSLYRGIIMAYVPINKQLSDINIMLKKERYLAEKEQCRAKKVIYQKGNNLQ